MSKYLVIGSGAIGLNICRELIENNQKVDLYATSLDTVSYNYGIGMSKRSVIPTVEIKPSWWIILYALLNVINNSYASNKYYLYNQSLNILRKHNIFDIKCVDAYELSMKTVIPKIITYLKSNKNFKYVNKTISDTELFILSQHYKRVYVCTGSHAPESIYNKNIGGYKIYIESKFKPKCLSIENGFLINTENNLLVIRGGFINGNKTDKQISNIIQKLSLWNTYKCHKIILITKDFRSVSLDNFPFYYSDKNITYIRGGSFVGCVIAPVLSYSIISRHLYGKNSVNFNFHISRLDKSIIRVKFFIILLFIILIISCKYFLNRF